MIHRLVVLSLVLSGLVVTLFGQSPAPQKLQAPLVFEPNHGQAAPSVRFLSRGNGRSFLLFDQEAVLSFADPALSIRMKLIGQNPNASIEGVGRQQSVTNYFHGNDPSKWDARVPHFAKVKYTGVYPGIDLIYYGNERQLEYDFEVQPFADYSAIEMEFQGMQDISIGPEGDLILSTPAGEVRHRRLVAYQRQGIFRESVDASFVLRGNRVGFDIGRYDPRRPLVIDPTFVWSSLIGSTGDDLGFDVALDNSGNVYVTGYTQTVTTSQDPPPAVTLQTDPARGFEMFVTKISSTGSLVFTTYVGGAGSDEGHAIALDSLGSIFVTGFTSSTDFPVVNAFQSTNGGVQDAYIVKLNSAGDVIQLSSFLGGDRGERGLGIAVDSFGNAYVAGSAHGVTNVDPDKCSSTFPIVNAIQPKYGCGLGDAFVTKITPAGTIAFSTFLGGRGEDIAYDIAVDADGDIVVTGQAQGDNFPVANALISTFAGGSFDGFITKLNSGGTSLIFSTYYGGFGDDVGTRLALDSNKTIYVTGYTTSLNFPLKNAPQTLPGGSFDAFLVKLHPDGRDADFSIFIGAEDQDGGVGVAVDKDGFIYVTGFTNSLGFFAINSLSGFLRGARDGFVMKIYPDASNLVYSTYLGGFGFDGGTSIAVDDSGNAYVTGFTTSFDFPTTDSAFQKTGAGGQDAFIAKINADDVKTSSAFSFAAGGGAQIASAGLTANPTFGYISAEVSAGLSPSALAIIDLRSAGRLVNEVSIPVSAPSQVGRVYGQTSTANTTALTLVNGNNEDVTVHFYFTASTGGTVSDGVFTIPAQTQVSGLLTGPPFNVPFDRAGTLTYDASLPLSAIALLVGGSGTAEPVNVYLPIANPSAVRSNPVVVPQVVTGADWTTTTYIVNPSENPISGEIRFYKGGLPGEPSQPLEMETTSGFGAVFPYSVESRGSFVLTGNPAGEFLTSGFAEIVPNPGSEAPLAFSTLQGRDAGGFVSTTVEAVEPASEFRMYAEASGTFTNFDLSATPALAITNSSAGVAVVNLSLIGFDGVPGPSGQLTLQPREHVSTYLRAVPGFENLPSPYTGVLRVTTSQEGVTVAGFRARYNEVGHFLVTATDLKDLGNTNPVIYPHLVDGGGYATQFILTTGAAGGAAAGTIRFFDSFGRALNLATLP
jgi:hypothetical protein